MNVFLIIPARGRYNVTRLCLQQKRHLADVLAPSGIQVDVVVVADDENIRVAHEHGFRSLRQRNILGLKVNDGFAYALEQGCDWACFCGSDDWIHPDFLAQIAAAPQAGTPTVVSGHNITVVDLETVRLRLLGERSRYGVSPWFIPARALERLHGRPVNDLKTRGMEGELSRNLLGFCDWTLVDPHDHCRVDFKSAVNMTAYDTVTSLGYGAELHGDDVWDSLAGHYPAWLVNEAATLAERTAA